MRNGPYILIKAPENYPGKRYRDRYAYEHIVEWWKNTGYIPLLGYQIHHVNGDTRDNRYANLEMIKAGTHAKLHGSKRKKTMKALICEWCKQPFIREKRNVEYKIRNGQQRFYCCKSHQVKYQHKYLS